MVKVISLSNEAYERLKALKNGEKSFSDVVIEITPKVKKKSIMDFVGMWKDDSDYWEKFEKDIRRSRNNAKMRGVKL
jgi:predicted CopG family antitoxin